MGKRVILHKKKKLFGIFNDESSKYYERFFPPKVVASSVANVVVRG